MIKRASLSESEEEEDDDENDDELRMPKKKNGVREVEKEEEEPILKYNRLAPSMITLLASESARCLIPHEKFLVLGTEKGNVYILDLAGDELLKKKIVCHSLPINDMSLDDAGEMVATCSNDGTVVISDIWADSIPQTKYQYSKPVYALSLANNFKLSQTFAAGGQAQQLVLNSKTWYSTREKILHAGDGSISTIRWNGDYIAWANGVAVRIYDSTTLERISSLNRSHGSSSSGGNGVVGESLRCCLAWANKDTLLIGWGTSVRVGVVKTKISDQPNTPPTRVFQIASVFHTSFSIYGLAPFGPQQIAFLTRSHRSANNNNNKATNNSDIKGEDEKSERVEFRVMTWGADEVINDVLPFFNLNNSKELSLQFLWCEETSKFVFYLISSKDIIVARHRGLDDHIQWLADRGKIEEALEAAENNPQGLTLLNLADISHRYLDELFARGEYKTAAANCPRLLKTNVTLWERRIALFAQHRQLQVVAEFIPYVQVKLSPFIYELVLYEFCLEDAKGLLELINKWSSGGKSGSNSSGYIRHMSMSLCSSSSIGGCGSSSCISGSSGSSSSSSSSLGCGSSSSSTSIGSDLDEGDEFEANEEEEEEEETDEIYNVNTILLTVEQRLASLEQDLTTTTSRSLTVEELQNVRVMKQKSTEYILEVLSILYVKTKRFADAVNVKLRLGKTDVFDLVHDLKLFDTIKDKLLALMNFNSDRAAELFVQNLDALPMENVISQLTSHPKYLHKYLHLLFLKDKNIGYKYHNKQVPLYAEYQPDMLMNFLKVSTQYLPEDALKVCEKYNLYEEMVYLLRNMGDPNRALKLLVLKVQDVQKAITFVEEHKDEQLWEELITLSLDRPEFLSDLLEHVGTHYVDMVRLIPRIPDDLKIPNLKLKLTKIFSDQQSQINVREGCNRILREDCRSLQSRFYSFQQQAWFVGAESRCEKCVGPILSRRERDNIIVFSCTHSYHAQCIEPYRTDRSSPIVCIQCSSLGQTHS